jgi:hypothetical protein
MYQAGDLVEVSEEKHGHKSAEPEVLGVVALPTGEPRPHDHPPDKLVDELNVEKLTALN